MSDTNKTTTDQGLENTRRWFEGQGIVQVDGRTWRQDWAAGRGNVRPGFSVHQENDPRPIATISPHAPETAER